MEPQNLFGHYRYCELCRRPLPSTYTDTVCPACQEHQLFTNVKEYIRDNDVTEYDVAEHFNIPRQQVKHWIKEGRIEYKDDRLNTHLTGKCQNCGTSILFGSLCSKCLKQSGMSGHGAAQQEQDTRMRFLEEGKRS